MTEWKLRPETISDCVLLQMNLCDEDGNWFWAVEDILNPVRASTYELCFGYGGLVDCQYRLYGHANLEGIIIAVPPMARFLKGLNLRLWRPQYTFKRYLYFESGDEATFPYAEVPKVEVRRRWV